MDNTTNEVELIGTLGSAAVYNHEVNGEKFFLVNVFVERLSGTMDVIPLMVSEVLLPEKDEMLNKRVRVIGQFRSYNDKTKTKVKLVLYVFVKDIELTDIDEDVNSIILSGTICKVPIFRITPMGREICDIILAINRHYNKSDYIPCVCWGRMAKLADNHDVGDMVTIIGRIQSREYCKDEETKTAYEVSVVTISNTTEKGA